MIFDQFFDKLSEKLLVVTLCEPNRLQGKIMRSLGHSNIRVAPLAIEGNVFGWTIDKKTSFEILDAFVDFGFNLSARHYYLHNT